MSKIDEIYQDSPRNINISTLCTDERFGTEVNFSSAVRPLERMVRDIVELEDLDYRENLTLSEKNNVEQARIAVLNFIEEIKTFSIGSSSNPAEQRNQIVQKIESYYENSFASLVRPHSIYLKSKIKETAKDEEQLRKVVAKTEEINAELETRLLKIKEQEGELEKDRKSLSTGQGIMSAKYLSIQFTNEAKKADGESSYWQKWVFWLSFALVIVLGALFAFYFPIRTIEEGSALKIEYGVFSITLIALIFFYLRVVLRNYNVEKHTASSNRHRANVAATIENLLATIDRDEGLKDALLKEGSIAMFNQGSTGYLDKEQMEVSTPVKEVITTFVKNGQN